MNAELKTVIGDAISGIPLGDWWTPEGVAQAALQAIKDAGQAIVPNGVVDALATAEAWLEAWGSHVGGCDGGSRCTCGLEAVKAEIGHAIYQAHQPKTGEGP